MTTDYTISLDDTRATLEVAGGKGASLTRLINADLPVPDGFLVTTAAYDVFVTENDLQPRILAALSGIDLAQPATLEAASRTIRDLFAEAVMPPVVAGAIAQAYAEMPGQSPSVAVRSSATAEDLPEASFAGQQDTYLNLSGAGAVVQAVKRCWASLWTARAIGYRLRQAVDPNAVSLAVVVQRLVPAEAAGILFTADPVNGARDRALISAAWGLGEAVVGGLVTPDNLTVDKVTGKVLLRETAHKQVMTVPVSGGTEEQPVPDELQGAPVLDDGHAAELIRLGVRIEGLYGMPMDIEWCWADGRFYIVQARPITALPEAGDQPAIDWTPPNPKGQYMRASVADFMPNPVSPLFASLAVPEIAGAGVREVLRRLTRSEPHLPNYIVTINSYVYITSGGYTLREWWWILTRMMLSMPRMLREAVPLWRDMIRPGYAATVARRQGCAPEELPAEALWAAIREVNDAAVLHFSSLLVATTGASAGAEMLFTNVYNKLIRHEGDPPAATFLMGYDSTPIRAEKSLYDLAAWVRDYPEPTEAILQTPTADLAAQLSASPPPSILIEFAERLQTHLRTYGHIVYDLDFAKPLPLDDPTPMLETIRMYLRGQGMDPHERQRTLAARREQAVATVRARLRCLRRWAFDKTLRIGQTMAAVREDALADIGLGYPILREMLRDLGRRLVREGAVQEAEDIFWLRADEVQSGVDALRRSAPLPDLTADVARRRARHAALTRITPPPMLPPRKRVMGVKVEALIPTAEEHQSGDTLKGVAASGGRVTAPACVLHGPEEFDRMRPGDVLVAGTTTPAWTPLFAMASAVVTDVGGPLSHGSIVAREYGIPAVMGTGIATRRIDHGQTITVDGNEGTVTLL